MLQWICSYLFYINIFKRPYSFRNIAIITAHLTPTFSSFEKFSMPIFITQFVLISSGKKLFLIKCAVSEKSLKNGIDRKNFSSSNYSWFVSICFAWFNPIFHSGFELCTIKSTFHLFFFFVKSEITSA